MENTEAQIYNFIAEASTKVDFGCLKRHFNETQHQLSSQTLISGLTGLMQSGKLCYTYHYGCSFIEISYDQPHVVSEHIVIKPPQCSLKALPGKREVVLGRGAAFGGGEHPTTRLAIQLIDAILHSATEREKVPTLRAIDIGTGSGVLAIAAVKLGLGFVCGVDIDPCAVFEARENVRLNFLEERIVVRDDELKAIVGPFDLVFANLRTPTLLGLRDELDKKTAADSRMIFSGLKTEETKAVCDYYAEAGFLMAQMRSEKGWTAICLARGD